MKKPNLAISSLMLSFALAANAPLIAKPLENVHFHLGGFAGSADSQMTFTNTLSGRGIHLLDGTNVPTQARALKNDTHSLVGGLTLGGEVVFTSCPALFVGLDATYTWHTHSEFFPTEFDLPVVVPNYTATTQVSLNDIAEIDLSIGRQFGCFAGYLKGGAAYTRVKTTMELHPGGTAFISETLYSKDHLWGYVIGVGGKTTLWRDCLSVFLEFDYYGFDDTTTINSNGVNATQVFALNRKVDVDVRYKVIKLGLMLDFL